MVYLDYAAASPVAPAVLKAMQPWFTDRFGNPSSLHRAGQEARAAVDAARMEIASFLQCEPTELFFTASGTESCDWAIFGTIEQMLLKGQQAHVVVSEIEHSAVLETVGFLKRCYGVQVTTVPVDDRGIVDLQSVQDALTKSTVLVSIMMVNNEVGSIQPIREIAQLCSERGILFHSDACQALSTQEVDLSVLSADLFSLNAAKIGGPKGIGLLYVRDGIPLSNWSFGGGQEFGKRSGTENVPAIVGFAEAVKLLQDSDGERERLQSLRALLWEMLHQAFPDCALNGDFDTSAPHILNVSFPGIAADSFIQRLDLEGFAVSAGSACSSGLLRPSHVLKALGHDDERATSSIRISIGADTRKEELESFVETLNQLVPDLQS